MKYKGKNKIIRHLIAAAGSRMSGKTYDVHMYTETWPNLTPFLSSYKYFIYMHLVLFFAPSALFDLI